METILLRPATGKEYALLYSGGDDKTLGCVGHLRGDFRCGNNILSTTWWPHQPDLVTPQFNTEFSSILSVLRGGLLKGRSEMAQVCKQYPTAIIPRAWNENTYGLACESEHYRYFLRCWAGGVDDYNLYIYCYKKEK